MLVRISERDRGGPVPRVGRRPEGVLRAAAGIRKSDRREKELPPPAVSVAGAILSAAACCWRIGFQFRVEICSK